LRERDREIEIEKTDTERARAREGERNYFHICQKSSGLKNTKNPSLDKKIYERRMN
jgi:hypothetical protein